MLLTDETRCHDAGCPERERCARYLERHTGGVHVASLFPFDEPIFDPCAWRIEPEPEAD